MSITSCADYSDTEVNSIAYNNCIMYCSEYCVLGWVLCTVVGIVY